jgi:predicted chitinase
MRASEIQPKKLVVFDIDDTLVYTQTKVHVIKDGATVNSLNSHDFTHYKLKPGESFDFGDFSNAKEFFDNSKPNIPMMNQLKRDINTGNKVVMVTARSDFDDKELFLDTFRKFGVDIDKVHVYRAGNSKQGTTEERKKQIIDSLLNKDDYTKAIMYDDAKPNLHTFIELKKDHPKTRFYAWHVSLDGAASEYMREGIVAEKKKRKKPRWAAYGPGPYGGYGFYAGYSGDGGGIGGDAAGGEGWKDWVAGAGVAAMAAGGGGAAYDAYKAKQLEKEPTAIVAKADAPVKIAKDAVPKRSVTGSPHEKFLIKAAVAAGITGEELAQFLAQTAHESHNFQSMVEYGGSLDFRKYDPKYAPKKAKALGNKKVGDGARFKGRGYIQLTGRYNYKRAGQALGLPLEAKPELVEKPEVAAQVAVWFWKNRVQPRVDDFGNTPQSTKPINSGLKGLQDRKDKFQDFKTAMQ